MSSSRDDFGIAIRSALLQRGAKQKFSLFVFICFSILIFFLDSFPNKFTANLKSLLNDGIYRTATVASSPAKFVGAINRGIISHFVIYKENKILKKEIEILKYESLNNEFLSTEYLKLKKLFDDGRSEKSSYVLAKVLLDKQSPFLKSIILNKGSKSGVKKGMPVLDQKYLIGRVVEVNYLSSRILLLNDLNSKLPVVIEPLATQGILSGSGEVNPTLYYLPQQFKTSKESTVFTSGKDGIFPSGIPVGKVLVEENSFNVKLFSDPGQLFYVNILVDDFTDTNF